MLGPSEKPLGHWSQTRRRDLSRWQTTTCCSTGLSQHEIVTEGYVEIVHPGLFVKFPIYNKDNLYIDSETLVFDFYKMLGRKKTRITREVADNGIKVLNKLFAEGYDTEFLRRLCEWSVEYCKQNRMNLYGIGFINYLLPEYLAEQEKITKQAKVRQKEMEKAKIRDNEMEREALLLMKYKQLPKHIKSIIMGKAKDLVNETLKETGNAKIGEYLEKMMLDGYITEIMENEYSN